MTDLPGIRAAATKDFLWAADQHSPGLREAILAVLEPEDVSLTGSSARIGWMPLPVHMAVIEAARRVGGKKALRPVWHRAMLRSFEQSTLRVIVEGAKRVFGMSPRGMIKTAPRGYGLLTRALGTLRSVDVGREGTGRLVLEEFPSAEMKSGTFVEGLAGCFESFFTVCKTEGRVVITEHDFAESRAVFELDWH